MKCSRILASAMMPVSSSLPERGPEAQWQLTDDGFLAEGALLQSDLAPAWECHATVHMIFTPPNEAQHSH